MRENSKVTNNASEKLDDYFQAILQKEMEKRQMQEEREDENGGWEEYRLKMKQE